MKNNKQILTSILKTSQMGQTGIRSVLDVNMSSGIHKALKSQLREYELMEAEAQSLADSRGWKLKSLDPAAAYLAGRMTRMKLSGNKSESRIADMMIQGNTQGMIKSLQDMHQYTGSDRAVSNLSQKLLDFETANIRQMQNFL